MLYGFRQYVKRRERIKKWRELNGHNETSPINDFNFSSVTVGKYTYGGIQVYNFNSTERLKIGNFCSIASDVMFILNAEHNLSMVSTFPFKAKCLYTGELEAASKGDIIVEDDVWIGYKATILSGVHIHQGAVIASGAVVTKDVPPYAIVGGVPAKTIRYRFKQDVINYLLSFDFEKLDKDIIRNHINDLYVPIDNGSLEELKRQYEWFPKKVIC